MEIDLNSELTFCNAFLYPPQSKIARKEVAWGALLVLVPVIGWLLNMGHRIQMVHQMQHGRDAWPAWHDYRRLLISGVVTFLGMCCYYFPGGRAGTISDFFAPVGAVRFRHAAFHFGDHCYSRIHDTLLPRL